jgi:hypothetical protein
MAKFDASKNEAIGEDFNSFPTLKYYRRYSKGAPVVYEGPKEIEDIREFIKEYSEDYRRYLEKTEL